MTKQQAIIDLIYEIDDNLEIAFLVSDSLKEIKRQLKNEFTKQIQEIGQELNLKVEGLNLIPEKWSKHKIAFSYEQGGLLYGIKRVRQDDSMTRLPEIETFIENHTGKKFKVSEWWPMWQFFYKNIENNEKFWLDVKTGEAKKRAKSFVKRVYDNFNTEMY